MCVREGLRGRYFSRQRANFKNSSHNEARLALVISTNVTTTTTIVLCVVVAVVVVVTLRANAFGNFVCRRVDNDDDVEIR